MKRENYERTELVITEFDSENVITTSGVRVGQDEYEVFYIDAD